MLSAVLREAGPSPFVTIVPLDVTKLGRRAPELILCDIDAIEVDPLEMLRRLRFVLPDCTIAVYTNVMTRERARNCHLAGANCLLAKASTPSQLSAGLSEALSTGCFTDPNFTAAVGVA